MKRLIAITGTLLIALIISGSVHSGQEINAKEGQEKEGQASFESEPDKCDDRITDEERYYYLREYRQRLAVYEEENTEPLYVTDIHLSSLPKADQQAIMDFGIRAKGKKALNRMLEDFCS